MANTFIAPEKARFRYRLQGFDTNWVEAGTRRMAYYTNLKPADYRFEVTACDHRGLWNEVGASFAFNVAPYYFQTSWFYLLAGVGAISASYGIHRLRVRVLRQIHDSKQRLLLETERNRLARDIHDDVGARLTRVLLHSELANLALDQPEKVALHNQQIKTTAREAIQALTEVVWTVNPEKDTLDHLATFICQYTEKFLNGTPIQFRFDFPERVPDRPISSELRHGLFMIVKEALHNVVKHSQATEVWVRFSIIGGTVSIAIEDNGRGFEPRLPPLGGDGLSNMEKRAKALGGSLLVSSLTGAGSTITVEAHLKDGGPERN